MIHLPRRASAPPSPPTDHGSPGRAHPPLPSSRIAAAVGGALVLPAAMALSVVGPAAPAGASGGSVSLVAYSTPKPAYAALIKAFQATKAGKGVSFSTSFGPSGTQATSVVNGLPADVVNFSLAPDIDKVVKAGIVSSKWASGPTQGFVTNSIVSFVVRKGNPKHITSWSDLIKSGVNVITPNPFSSGSAKWNIMAAYGAQLNQGKSKAEATAYLTQLLKHTVAQPTSASAALQTFLSGQGNVLLDYEDDALYAVHKGEPVSVITPPQTILIQNPIAVTAKASSPAAAKAFVAYLLSPAGQQIWGKQGYRPVLASVASKFHFPKPQKLFTISSLGGWTKVDKTYFDPQTGVVAKIEAGQGVSTASG